MHHTHPRCLAWYTSWEPANGKQNQNFPETLTPAREAHSSHHTSYSIRKNEKNKMPSPGQKVELVYDEESSEEESDDGIPEKESDDNWDEDEERETVKKMRALMKTEKEDEDMEDKEENEEDREVSSEKELNGDSDLDPENESEEERRQKQPVTRESWLTLPNAIYCILPGRLALCQKTRSRHMLPSSQSDSHTSFLS